MKVTKEILFQDLLENSSSTASAAAKISEPRKCHPFESDEAFHSYVKCVIFKRKRITRRALLNLLGNYDKRLPELDRIMVEILSEPSLEVMGHHGQIKQIGDGVRGYKGQGPVMYEWKEIK